ncbi:hypothetical protein [Lunatibacter salilacus]|uniref:hypothetical protein n=1 Tax=Lunatibacter salilacus TaxID=2483804 RepID=UPI00131E21D4|nr:hypothetical protein [Lunatibacter salilacus]
MTSHQDFMHFKLNHPSTNDDDPLRNQKPLENAITKRVAAILKGLETDLTNPVTKDESKVLNNWFGDKKKRGLLRWLNAQISRFTLYPKIASFYRSQVTFGFF